MRKFYVDGLVGRFGCWFGPSLHLIRWLVGWFICWSVIQGALAWKRKSFAMVSAASMTGCSKCSWLAFCSSWASASLPLQNLRRRRGPMQFFQ